VRNIAVHYENCRVQWHANNVEKHLVLQAISKYFGGKSSPSVFWSWK